MQKLYLPTATIANLTYLGEGVQVLSPAGVIYQWNGSNYAAPGGAGGGVSSFTDLAEAPASITPRSILTGSPTGDSLVFPPEIQWMDGPDGYLSLIATAPGESMRFSLGSFVNPEYEPPETDVMCRCDQLEAELAVVAISSTGSSRLRVNARVAGGVEMALTGSGEGAIPMMMTGFDVAASDATARLTVGGTEYSVAKAIRIMVGTDTYFWPLFGPAA